MIGWLGTLGSAGLGTPADQARPNGVHRFALALTESAGLGVEAVINRLHLPPAIAIACIASDNAAHFVDSYRL